LKLSLLKEIWEGKLSFEINETLNSGLKDYKSKISQIQPEKAKIINKKKQ